MSVVKVRVIKDSQCLSRSNTAINFVVYLLPMRKHNNKNPARNRDLLYFRVFFQPPDYEPIPFVSIQIDDFANGIDRLMTVLEVFIGSNQYFEPTSIRASLVRQIAQIRTAIED